MNRRLAQMMAKIEELPGESIILDCYNQAVVKDVAITITTRINDCNHYFLLEKIMKQDTDHVMQIGNTTETPKRKNPNAGHVYDTDGVAPTITACGGGNREPQILEPISCAIRGRNPENYSEGAVRTEQRLELGDNVANCLTTVQKDSLVAEPTAKIVVVGNIYPSASQAGKVVDPDGLAPCVTENHGEVTRIVERGRVVNYKEMSDGSIRGFNPNRKDKSGISEEQYTNPNSISPTIVAAREPKVIETAPLFRIRKLTPRECFRLMDVPEDAIDRIQSSPGPRGKGISKTQQYKMAGNSIVTACPFYILKELFIPTQPTLFDNL